MDVIWRQSDPRSVRLARFQPVTTCLCSPACQRTMWSSKMAARWRGDDGDLNAGNSDFLSSNTPNEMVLSSVGSMEMDTQSCMDNSILAIFEDSTVSSEYKSGAEEESETLLSALTEMLDSVEDDDATLSPFDTLPDTQLLIHHERRDPSVEQSLADRLRPRSKSPNVIFTMKIDGEKEDRNSRPQLFKPQIQTSFHSTNKKAEDEVEVFTSTSLVNLVKLMHPYCLKLQVEEEGDKLRKNHTVFAQEEVWKYERPSEESDEEINVVSDDEVTLKDTEEDEEGAEERARNVLLKSVLLNGNSSTTPSPREKKRVSFGSVRVASFESTEKGLNERNLTTSETASAPLISPKALEKPSDSALEPQTLSSEMSSNKVSVHKGETKAKSLSLQQYRQLRQTRQPLVEKQGNYTTMWPCVSETPKELTPILCLQGQGQNSCGLKAAQLYPDGRINGADPLHLSQAPGHQTLGVSAPPTPHSSEPKPSTHLRRSGLKRSRTETKILSPASLQPDVTANTNVNVPESKKSPVKKPTLLSSDPPNPVLLPLPVSRTTSPTSDPSSPESKVEILNRDSDRYSTRHFTEIHNKSSGTSLNRRPSSSGPKPEVFLINQGCTILLQEIKNRLTEIASGVSSGPQALCRTTTQIKSASESKKLQPQRCILIQTKEEAKLEPKTPLTPGPQCFPSEEPTPTLQLCCGVQTDTADSGIEAPDLTSLLEQFEETQAKEERVCEKEPEPKLAPSQLNLQTHGHLDFDRTTLVVTQRSSVETLEPLSTSESPGNPETLRSGPPLHMSEGADIPEALGTEIILRTQLDLPARRRNPPSKTIQIIDPRPLPSRKMHTSLPAAHVSPHILSSVASDHDYCGSVDRSLTSVTQRNRASKPKDVSQTSDESQVTTHPSSAAAECKKQTSTGEVSTTIRAVGNSDANTAMQLLSEQPRTRSETSPSTDVVPSDSAATKTNCVFAAEDETASCTLPTPPPSPPARGREKRRYGRRSPCSDSSSSSPSSSSSSSSASPSPKRQKRRHKRSESSSCSSSSPSSSISRSPRRRYRWSYSRSRLSRSRSRSWSQSRSSSRSRSPSLRVCRGRWTDVYSRESRKLRREHEIRIQKLKAIDERRVVYVGRIRRTMTHDELRERFSQFGDVECVSLHFRDRGDHYGFVTFYNMDDAFAAIDNGGKLRKPDELPFDICFGGRRQFCNSYYADLDANRDAEPAPAKTRAEDLDFDSLLKQAQRGLKS
ncbi:peroxisome proliferator-activated receptor gamma coactivator-related protein 1 isoform X2 [Anoplopoma fimbria]|uniref:peroxisome proliferator-activated receptor gamma coactivator-related protein 1 isoform X2 n=1 Tax=Anoplopoma fimbria TaxID=229290 RepID=UPI0023EA8F7C|nr:peroxisome proliferator-activated receptor gamma coactivator-related protein 1 isoform X2 [Anoplopoma fimbria]